MSNLYGMYACCCHTVLVETQTRWGEESLELGNGVDTVFCDSTCASHWRRDRSHLTKAPALSRDRLVPHMLHTLPSASVSD